MTPNNSENGILWLKLDIKSKEHLRRLYPPKYPNSFYDHVTLAYDIPRSLYADLVGNHAAAKVQAYAVNEKVEAVRVQTTNLPDSYGAPHITLSTAAGIKPYESVTMLHDTHDEIAVPEPFELTGTVEFVALQ